MTSLASFKLNLVALLKLSNWFTYLDRCVVISQARANGDVVGITYSSFWQTHPTLFSYRWVKILITQFRDMIHNPVKLSLVASRIHSTFAQVKNYGCGTRRIWKISMNLIMVELHVLMFLSSICRNSKHLIFVCFEAMWSLYRLFVFAFLPIEERPSFLIAVA